MASMKLSHPKRWIAGALGVLVIGLALLLAFFDWNWLREPIARRVSESTGRSFAIRGDLDVRLSLRPRIVARDVVLGNAAWGSEPVMAQVDRIDLRIDLPALLSGRIELPELALSQPRVAFEADRGGTANWVFKDRAQDDGYPLSIGKLSIDKGRATFRDAEGTDLAFTLWTLQGEAAAPPFGVELAGKGRYKGQPVVLKARGGDVLTVRADRPYPVEANASVGSTQVGFDGVLLDPLHFKGEKLNFRVAGTDLALLFPLVGVPLPATGTSWPGSWTTPATCGR